MDFFNILMQCNDEVQIIFSVVKWAVRLICIAIPIVLIVLVILDLAKVVTAGNIDDKMKKEVSQKVVTRVVYSILIFLVPTLVNLFFGLLPSGVKNNGGTTYEANWWTCYKNAGDSSNTVDTSGTTNVCAGWTCTNARPTVVDGHCECR